MRFMSILLKEGRKEDLKKRYSNKFSEENLDWILNISDLVDFNHKYSDFVLKNLNPNSETFDEDVQTAVEVVKDFDKYQSKLTKKDINQYKSIQELDDALEIIVQSEREKEEERTAERQVDKIYEDDSFLVVKPKTELASCKYGSNTKWCVTSRGAGHFDRYTSGRQGLYFIINKKNSTNKNYSKIAIHFDNSGHERYWDSQDVPMNDREISIFNYAFPEIISAIKADYKESSKQSIDIFLNEVFNNTGASYRIDENVFSSDSKLELIVNGFETINDLGPGHAHGGLTIKVNNVLIDRYLLFITFNNLDSRSINLSIGFMGDELQNDDNFVDTELEDWGFDAKYLIKNNDPVIMADSLRNYIANRVMDKLKESKNLQKKVIGTNKFWRPNRSSYGYTFKTTDKGLVKKLVDWLDASKIGTKLDFLTDIGKLQKKIEQGKPLYSFPDRNSFESPSRWRGQFSSFFASAKNAGILDYRKVGKEYFLIKGPNFEAFKEGKLRAL